MRKTKIICTLGPATDREGVLRDLILAGMNVARFNFSHGSHGEHLARFKTLCALREELNRPVAALLDTKGPEIRLGCFADDGILLKAGQAFTLTTRDIVGNEEMASVSYAGLPNDVAPGARILIDDGLIELSVTSVHGTEILCRAMNSGVVSDRKGINVPDVTLSMPFISEKDEEDILFAIEHGFDFVAASFARSASDILEIRQIFERENCNSINIIAKIENMQGVSSADEIIRVSDGIMIARGDMGVEIPLEELPVIQKMLIKKVYGAGKQVITATQMLDSMIKNPRPTRAEATDVANAIYDGTSAIMLSGETAVGLYPVEAVKTMARLAVRTEKDIDYAKRFKLRSASGDGDVTTAISHATCDTAHELTAGAIITVTKSGRTARMISKFRPACPIVGCCTDATVSRQLNLSWGVTPLLITEQSENDELLALAVDVSEQAGIVSQGELVVITMGVPLGVSGTTNLMKVHVVGHVLLSGQGITDRSVCAGLCVCQDEAEALKTFRKGSILVIPKTSNELMPILRQAAGLITEEKGKNSHGAVVALSLELPALIGAENATRLLKTGPVVKLDPVRGILATCDTAEGEGIGLSEIVLAGGCFWGVEKFLSLIRGVSETETGYANGKTDAPAYEQVCTGETGFAEAVRVVYDREVLPLSRLLALFFEAIDPVSVNRQGNDSGTQYRTGIYYTAETDGKIISAALAKLQEKHKLPLAVEALPLFNYYKAEDFHQKYLDRTPGGYCHIGPAVFKKAVDGNPA